MLGFVLDPRFPPPSDDEYHGDPVNMAVQQRGNRVYHIALPAVLHVNYGDLSRSQVIAGRQGHAVPLIGPDDVVLGAYSIFLHQVIA